MSRLELISLPALGLGTSRLGHHPTTASALYSLDLAFDHGIAYYDTAPIYGYGWSEKLLGTFARQKRDKVQIATKIGLQPSRILSVLPYHVLVAIRKFARTLKGKQNKGLPAGVSRDPSISFNPAWALQSLEESLRRLKTDYVDVLLLHESTIKEANEQHTKEFMMGILQSGKARAIGIGSSRDKLANINTLDPAYKVVQHEYNLLSPQTFIPGDRIVNTHGLYHNMIGMKSIAQETWFQSETRKTSALDFSLPSDVLQFCLAGARYEYPHGITLFSSTNQEHIKDTITSWNNLSVSQQQFQETISTIRKHVQVQ